MNAGGAHGCTLMGVALKSKGEHRPMGIIEFIILLVVAGVCGSLGQAIGGYSRGGCLVSIALGFIGALLGMWLAHMMGLPELYSIQFNGTNFPIIWSIIGSALFVAVLGFLSRRRPPGG